MGDTTEFDRLLAVNTPDPVNRPSTQHPTGWEPGVDTAKGVIVTAPSESPDAPDDWAQILEEFRLDPAKWTVDGDSVNVRTWDAAVGDGQVRRFFYFRANVRPKVSHRDADLDALIKRISKHRYRPSAPDATEPTSALVVCLADWQAGPDPQGLVDAILRLKSDVVELLKQSKSDVLYVVGMGDMIEACDGHYAMQTFATGAGGLNGRRDQVKLVRRLLVSILCEWARYAPKLVVGCVPGNHGENRRDGKAFTTFEDNDDLAVFEQASEVLAANPECYGHVRFVIPDGDMSLTLDIAGTVCSFIHGHQARKGGATPRQRLENWWSGKMKAKHPVSDASLLVAGHLHHLVVVQDGPRTIMQCPAQAQSRWFEEGGGSSTKTGTLTFHVGPDGWDRLRVV